MKNKTIWNAVFALALTALLQISCNDEQQSLGFEVLPENDALKLIYQDTVSMTAHTLPPDSVNTRGVSKALLGKYEDEIFGITKAGFVTRLRAEYPYRKANFENPVFDSLFLSLTYIDTTNAAYYGNTSVRQQIDVFELLSPLNDSLPYYSNHNVDEYGLNKVFDLNMIISPTMKTLRAELPESFGEYLLNKDSLVGEGVKNIIYGLYFTPAPESPNGAIAIFDLLPQTTKFELYFHHGDDEKKDSIILKLDQYVLNFNVFEHDYSGTPVETSLNINAGGVEDSVFYLQEAHGVNTEIEFSRSSFPTDIIIQKAELYLPIEENSDYYRYPPPKELLLLNVDEAGDLSYITGFTQGKGGVYDQNNQHYRMNITRYLQRWLDQEEYSGKLRIIPANDKIGASRAVINNRHNGVKLKFTYSKLNN